MLNILLLTVLDDSIFMPIKSCTLLLQMIFCMHAVAAGKSLV